jgi:hypothetical protein
VDQDSYDQLLWACNLNFVRGEDSCVRAQWAARPLVWQAYPQADAAHWDKTNALLAHYIEGLDATMRRARSAISGGTGTACRPGRISPPAGRHGGRTRRRSNAMPKPGAGGWTGPADLLRSWLILLKIS